MPGARGIRATAPGSAASPGSAHSSSRAAPCPRPSPPPTRAGGAWHPRYGAGERRFAGIGALELESGAVLEDVTLAYESWGQLAADRSNAVLVLHALTGDSHVRGPAGRAHPSAGWWEEMVGP